jgi:hypothetical protein
MRRMVSQEVSGLANWPRGLGPSEDLYLTRMLNANIFYLLDLVTWKNLAQVYFADPGGGGLPGEEEPVLKQTIKILLTEPQSTVSM